MAGSIFTGDVIKSQLEDANRNYYGQRTWAKLFGDLDLSKQLGTENLIRNYGTIMGEAYKASKANQSAILGSNLGQGYKQAALDENQLALEKAYDSYMSQYLSDQQALNKGVAQERAALNQELNTLAQRTADYGNAHFDYLQALWDKHKDDKLGFNPFAQENFSRYVNNTYDDDGNIVSSNIKSIGEMEGIVFDKNGNLTQAGIDFFDMLEHDDILSNYSFSDYLRENDEELYNWATSENQYDFAPNVAGLNIKDGMFRRMVGQSSLDEQYTFVERAYGLKDGELNSAFTRLQTLTDNLFNSLNVKQGVFGKYKIKDKKTFNESVKSYGEEFTKLVGELGLSEQMSEILKERGYNSVSEYTQSLVNNYLDTLDSANKGVTLEDAYEKVGKDEPMIGQFFGTIFNYFNMIGADEKETDIVDANEQIRVAFNSLISDLVNYSKGLND